MPRPVVFVCCDHFLPGYKAGGPIATLGNLTANLGDDFEFKVITRDRDINSPLPYSGVTRGRWERRFGAEVFYLQKGPMSSSVLVRQLREVEYDLLYINSFFSPLFSGLPLLARRLGRIPRRPVIVAPRGELAAGARSIKATKKQAFIRVAGLLGLHRDVLWQAASPHELDDIRQFVGPEASVALAANLARKAPEIALSQTCRKERGEVRMLCLGRVSAVKNTAEALRILGFAFRGRIVFDIAGPQEDEAYWNECEALAQSLPENVTVRFLGAVPTQTIPELLSRYHVMFSPTTGENFGHAILEAMMCRCPVLISDRTPWRNLRASHAGWEFSLQARDQFRSAIQDVLEMDQETFLKWRQGAYAYASRHFSEQDVKAQNRQLFHQALGWTATRRAAA